MERDEEEINEDEDVEEIYPALLPPLLKGQHKMKAVSSHSEQWKKVSCAVRCANRTETVWLTMSTRYTRG